MNMRDLVSPRNVEPHLQTQHSNMKKTNTTTIIAILISLAVLTVIGCFVYGVVYRPYSAVYLSTGDIYYGKLSYFPQMKLYSPWFIQKTEDGQLALSKFADAVWKPGDAITISRDKIVFITRLESDSPVIDAIDGKQSSQQYQQQTTGQQQQTGQQQTTGQQQQIQADDTNTVPNKDATTNIEQPKRN